MFFVEHKKSECALKFFIVCTNGAAAEIAAAPSLIEIFLSCEHKHTDAGCFADINGKRTASFLYR